MSIGVSRESISKLMGELVDTFPMESEGRSSISDFGKLLFTEGQASTAPSATTNASAATSASTSVASAATTASNSESGEQDSKTPAKSGSKRVFTEIKGVPRQKQHDIMKSKDKAVPKRWSQQEDDKLREAVSRHGERNWKSIAEEVPGRNHTQCLQRWTKVLAPGLVKGHWRPDEDDLLKELVAEGRKNWGQVATRIPGRTSKQCRERWYNHLDPSIVRGEYTAEEDRVILDAQSRLGNRWSAIAAMLPGRTEDAVKIRWKSLCRVRKGQTRRAQAEKSKMAAKGLPGQTLGGHLMGHRGGFNGGMVKSDEVGGFSMQPQPQMMRLPNGQVVSAASMGLMGPPNMNPPMMYTPDMSGGGYDPTMAHYHKSQQQQQQPQLLNSYGHSLPPTVPMAGPNSGEFAVDRRANAVNLSSQPQPVYRQAYATPTGYSSGMSGGMYGSEGMNNGATSGQVYGDSPQMGVYGRGGGMLGSQQLSPQQQQHMMNSAPYNYGLPPTPTAGSAPQTTHPMAMGSGMNPAAAFVQQQQQQQQQYVEHTPSPAPAPAPQQQQQPQHMAREQEQQPNPEKEPPSPPQQNGDASKGTANRHPTPSSAPNPAAMFARSQQPKASVAPSPVAGGNPVAAFLQQQQQQKRKEQPSSANSNASSNSSVAGATKPFNPAAAFAQRFQAAQRSAASSSSSNGNDGSSSNSNIKSGAGAEEDDSAGRASMDKTAEPSLKKVKPRLSIDAARASAARRLRSSGSGGNLAGRGSLDVFLNEIGDVGRLSDLKMDEFQTLEDLWRVSGDMDRLSL